VELRGDSEVGECPPADAQGYVDDRLPISTFANGAVPVSFPCSVGAEAVETGRPSCARRWGVNHLAESPRRSVVPRNLGQSSPLGANHVVAGARGIFAQIPVVGEIFLLTSYRTG
jgi:hypothetical protein